MSQQIFGAVHFLSLEIDNNTNAYYRKIDVNRIKSVFVQNPMRYEYLFPGKQLKVFFVQNAPTYDGTRYETSNRNNFIWAGAIDKRLAVLDCLEFFRKYPEYKLVLKGGANRKMLAQIQAEYKSLLEEKRITINQDYLKNDSFIAYLSGFRIGFCFYDWTLIRENFNYQTAPSGKLFMCLAAGTPVIACNIPGFQLIKDFHAGILIDDYKPETILEAVKLIESDYQYFSEGCYKAAAHFSFDKSVAPYIQYLINEEGG
jgi:glycosyltransferase involved in cell wall biosynthesis